MQGRDFKRSSSAFIDGFRYNIRTLSRYLLNRYDDLPIPMQRLQATPQALSRAVLERACRTSALWAQFGYLCDVFVMRDAVTIDWYEELPLQALQEGDFATEAHYYSLTFEWGQWQGDVMAIARHPHGDEAHRSVFLHPIIRRYAYGKLISEHHILEDLFGIYTAHRERGTVRSRSGREMTQYHQEMHEQPLEQYFEQEFRRNERFIEKPGGQISSKENTRISVLVRSLPT